MIIRKNQIQSIENHRIGSFRLHLKKHLTEHFPESIPKDDNEWDVFLNKGLKNAKTYRLGKEYSITVYFNAMMCLGMNFDRNLLDYPWASDLLTDKQLRESEKIRSLIRHTEEELKKMEPGGN